MSGFTSGTQAIQGRTVNHDERPYVRTYNRLHETRVSGAFAESMSARFENGFGEIVVTRHDPRPEFAVLDNPILAAYRLAHEAPQFDSAQTWLDDLTIGSGDAMWIPATDRERSHARRVLSKLVALS